MAEVYTAIAEMGLWGQLTLHSRTSQYGQQTRGPRLAGSETRETLTGIMAEIKDGTFAREWSDEQQNGLPYFSQLWNDNLADAFVRSESDVKRRLNRTADSALTERTDCNHSTEEGA